MENILSIIENLSSKRLRLDHAIFTRFVDGSPDEVLKTIESQMNSILDEYDVALTNVLEIIREEIETLRSNTENNRCGEWCRPACCKDEHLPTNTR